LENRLLIGSFSHSDSGSGSDRGPLWKRFGNLVSQHGRQHPPRLGFQA